MPLREYFSYVDASDVFDYGVQEQNRVVNFLRPLAVPPHLQAEWIITNPPFNLAQEFAQVGIQQCGAGGVALLVRTAFFGTSGRWHGLFRATPSTQIFQFTERVPMRKGRLDRKDSTAKAYCWAVWRKGEIGEKPPEFHWISECRKRLELDADYF